MNVLFVHGMGRSPLSGWPLLRELKINGFNAQCFSYFVSLNSFEQIESRLRDKILKLAQNGEYILIGHSLGGVLIRSALNSIGTDINLPKHVFLLGSPLRPSRLAIKLSKNLIFKGVTRDCGQLLSSFERMKKISKTNTPTTCVVGTKSIFITKPFFKEETNDGVVSHSEITADWFDHEIQLPIIHSALPSSKKIGKLIVQIVNT